MLRQRMEVNPSHVQSEGGPAGVRQAHQFELTYLEFEEH